MKIIIIFIDLLMATVLFFCWKIFYQIKEYRKKCAVFIRRLYWIKYRENMQSYLENGLRHGQCSFVLAV